MKTHDIEQELKERKYRLKEIKTKGADALSLYDKEIASGGDIELAIKFSKKLIKNQISYLEEQLVGKTVSLFK